MNQLKQDSKLHDITFILDRSGSMESMRTDAIGGFNAYLKEQKARPGACHFTLIQFDDVVDLLHAGPIADCNELTAAIYQPRGSTALLDAVGRAISDAERRPGLKTIVVLTDGQENASKEWTWETIGARMKELQEKQKWDFVFIGSKHADWDRAQHNFAFYAGVPTGNMYGGLDVNIKAATRSAGLYSSEKRANDVVAGTSWQVDDEGNQVK